MTDLVIESGDLIGDRRHPRELKHQQSKELGTHIQLEIDATLQAHRSGVQKPAEKPRSPPYFLLPISFENHRVQENSTVTLFCTMTGVVDKPANLQLAHKKEGTFISSSSSNPPSGNSATTSTSILHFSPQNPPPSPIQDLLTIPVENPSSDFMSQLMKRLTHEISSREFAYSLACALAESATYVKWAQVCC